MHRVSSLVLALTLLPCLVSCSDGEVVTAPIDSQIVLEGAELLSGGKAVLSSPLFVTIILQPAVEEPNAGMMGRWQNLRVMVNGVEVDSRRIGAERVEFDVPTLPAGTYAVDVMAGDVFSSRSVQLLGVIASRRVNDDCGWNTNIQLVVVDDEAIFGSACWQDGEGRDRREGYATFLPAVPSAGMRWLPGLFADEDEESLEGENRSVIQAGPSVRPGHFLAKRRGPVSSPPDIWVWKAGAEPEPVAQLTCFSEPGFGASYLAAVAELSDNVCLAFTQGGRLLRNGQVIGHLDGTSQIHSFDLAPDGWAALNSYQRVAVFDPVGTIVHLLDPPADGWRPLDMKFSADGERLYIAWSGFRTPSTMLEVVDRATGESILRIEREGAIQALSVVDDRLWLVRTTSFDELWVELYDAETLEQRRAITVSSDLLEHKIFGASIGGVPVVFEDHSGTRVFLAGWVEDRVGVRAHIVQVF